MNGDKKAIMGWLIFGAIIGAIITIGAYEYEVIPAREKAYKNEIYQEIYNEIWNTAYNAGKLAGMQQVVRPASLEVSISNSTFNFSSVVDTNGSVSTETTISAYVTIENPDDITAEDIYITLYNPLTEKGGLHENLEVEELEAYISSGGIEYALYYNGDYTDGFALGDLASGGKANVTFKITFTEAVAGTFQDGQTYTCYLYVYQKEANYPLPIKFVIKT